MEQNAELNELEKEKQEQLAIAKENKFLSILLPVVGIIAMALGIPGFVLTLGQGNNGVTVFYMILAVLGVGLLVIGILMIIKLKNPNFMKKKEKVEEDIIAD